jgi:anti-anti-sigma factor
MSDLKIDQQSENGVSVGLIKGRLDLHGAAVLESYAQQRLTAGDQRLVLDLSGVDYISSAGLRALLVVAKKVQAINGRLVLCALTPMVLNVMTISGFQQLLKICTTQAEAVTAAASAAA